ncbi:hypothetical protein [Haloarchaeobius sp. DFWS5]|uniref:hypothetical protein n=1 Tax=Haloarchaeobius sp. DFWS5 TaxID=3446114 RepID=UPI003EB94584
MDLTTQLHLLLVGCWLAFALGGLALYQRGDWSWQNIRVGLVGAIAWTAFAIRTISVGPLADAIVIAAVFALAIVYLRDRDEQRADEPLALEGDVEKPLL